MAVVQELIVDMKQVVVESDKNLPHIGTEYDTDGFKWDQRNWPTDDEKKATASLPTLWDASIGGVDYDTFQSGIGSKNDLEFKEVTLERVNNSYRWAPIVSHGYYYRYYNERYLYSSESIAGTLSLEETVNSQLVNTHYYFFGLKQFIPVSSHIYRRNDYEGVHVIDVNIRQRSTFSGLIVDGVELDTVGSGDLIIWANVDTSKAEFIINKVNERFIFNKVFTERVGIYSLTPTVDDVVSCELIGEGSGVEGTVLMSKYFPILSADAAIYVYDPIDATFEEWTIVSDITQSTSGDKDAELDYDTGVVIFGDGVTFGSIPPAMSRVYMTYQKTAKIEYEPETSSDEHISRLDINPLRLGINRGFIFLSESESFLSKIEVSVDKPNIGENLYGPVYIGGDYAIISATAYNASGQTLPNINVTFDIASGQSGYINGQQQPAEVVTDYRGRAFVQFNSITDLTSVSVVSSDLDGAGTTLTLPSSTFGWVATNDVYTFQLRDDDSLQEGRLGTEPQSVC